MGVAHLSAVHGSVTAPLKGGDGVSLPGPTEMHTQHMKGGASPHPAWNWDALPSSQLINAQVFVNLIYSFVYLLSEAFKCKQLHSVSLLISSRQSHYLHSYLQGFLFMKSFKILLLKYFSIKSTVVKRLF